MRALAEQVWRLDQWPRPVINVYRAGEMLIDAGTKQDRGRILSQIEGLGLSTLALTHVHPDHQGCAKLLREQHGMTLACHEDDVDAMEGRRPIQEAESSNPLAAIPARFAAGPPTHVDRPFTDGEMLGDFRAVHTPGHSRGHTVFFREADRVAICGDVVRSISYLTLRVSLLEPPDAFTYDPAENRRSIRKLADLEPSIILPGHGPAITDMDEFKRFVEALPSD